jgi:hypothetical protein
MKAKFEVMLRMASVFREAAPICLNRKLQMIQSRLSKATVAHV